MPTRGERREASPPLGWRRRRSSGKRASPTQPATNDCSFCSDDEGGDASGVDGVRCAQRSLPRANSFIFEHGELRTSTRSLLRRSSCATPGALPHWWAGRRSSTSTNGRLSVADGSDEGEREMATQTGRHLVTHVLLASSVLFNYLVLHAHALRNVAEMATLASLAAGLALFFTRGQKTTAVLRSPLALASLLWLYVALQCAVTAACARQLLLAPECAAAAVMRCVHADFWKMFLPAASCAWLIAGVPARLIWFPELIVSASTAAATAAAVSAAGELGPRAAAMLLCQCVLRCVWVPLVFAMLYMPQPSVELLLADIDTAPRALRPLRDATLRAGDVLRRRLVGGAHLLNARTCMVITAHGAATVPQLAWRGLTRDTMTTIASQLIFTELLVLAAAVLARARGADPAALTEMRDKLAQVHAEGVLAALRAQLAAASSDADMLAAGAAAAAKLFPDASALALGAFEEATGCDALSALEVAAPSRAWQRALAAALPADVGAQPNTSVARACGELSEFCEGSTLLTSRAQPAGVAAFTDWAAAVNAGLASTCALTKPLAAGSLVVGFATLHFAQAPMDERGDAAALRALCAAVGAAIAVRRASAISEFISGAAAGASVRALSPRRRSTILVFEQQQPAAARSDEDDALLSSLDATAAADAALLRDWALDPWALPEEALVPLLTAMFHARGLLRRLRLSPAALRALVEGAEERYGIVAFHNWRHSFTVTLTAWRFLDDAPALLPDPLDQLALLVAALCHDLEHPGTTNAYHVNTSSELALRYNDVSVLENHHAAACFALLEDTRLLAPLSAAERAALRRAIVAAILATDSACARRAMTRVRPQHAADAPRRAVTAHKALLARAQAASACEATDAHAPEHRTMLVSYLLHCADLCTPLLPHARSKSVAAALATEFEAQAACERAAGLPVTVMLAADAAAKARQEISFIGASLQRLVALIARMCTLR